MLFPAVSMGLVTVKKKNGRELRNYTANYNNKLVTSPSTLFTPGIKNENRPKIIPKKKESIFKTTAVGRKGLLSSLLNLSDS